jgi:hypothetical protein
LNRSLPLAVATALALGLAAPAASLASTPAAH